MEYVLYIMAAIGVHNLWMYQKIMIWPKAQVRKLTIHVAFLDELITCPACFMMWCLLILIYAGPYIPDGLIYALAAYPLALLYLSFKTSSTNLSKKLELYLDNKAKLTKMERFGTIKESAEVTGNVYKGGGKIVRPAPTNAPMSFTPASMPVKKAEEGCTECEKAKKEREMLLSKIVSGSVAVILTSLNDFNPAYSITSVVKKHVHMLAKQFDNVVVITSAIYKESNGYPLGPIPSNVRVANVLPADFNSDSFVDRYKKALIAELMPTGSAKIFTHDLLYQESYLPIAKALHEIGDIKAFEWYHLIHSGIPASRPVDQVERCSVPTGHNIIVLNRTDVARASAYYQTKNVYVWRNQVSIEDAYPFTADALKLVHAIPADSTVISVLAADANRLKDKGLLEIISIHNALQRAGTKTCLIVIDSYNNRSDYPERRTAWDEAYTKDNGTILFMSTITGKNQMERSDVFGLLSLSDVFIFPSYAESSSLLIQEAALAKNLLVLNSSVPQMVEQIPHKMALYYSFGGSHHASRNIDYDRIARDIITKLNDNEVLQAKQHIYKQGGVVPV